MGTEPTAKVQLLEQSGLLMKHAQRTWFDGILFPCNFFVNFNMNNHLQKKTTALHERKNGTESWKIINKIHPCRI